MCTPVLIFATGSAADLLPLNHNLGRNGKRRGWQGREPAALTAHHAVSISPA
jgi:hypothetical protein